MTSLRHRVPNIADAILDALRDNRPLSGVRPYFSTTEDVDEIIRTATDETRNDRLADFASQEQHPPHVRVYALGQMSADDPRREDLLVQIVEYPDSLKNKYPIWARIDAAALLSPGNKREDYLFGFATNIGYGGEEVQIYALSKMVPSQRREDLLCAIASDFRVKKNLRVDAAIAMDENDERREICLNGLATGKRFSREDMHIRVIDLEDKVRAIRGMNSTGNLVSIAASKLEQELTEAAAARIIEVCSKDPAALAQAQEAARSLP